MSVTKGSILMSIAHCDRRIADADSELERLRGRSAARGVQELVHNPIPSRERWTSRYFII
jgi:hypothetical protein